MSHVDEGTLHALLDGALAAADPAGAERVELHLAACPDCRARLEEAARLRDEASALLGAAEPRALALPSFDAIRARAAAMNEDDARTLAKVPRRSRRLALLATPFNGFAWAASVVLAVGLGWVLHDTVGDPQTLAMRQMSEQAATSRADDAPIVAMAEESARAPSAGIGAAEAAAPATDARARPETRSSAGASQQIPVEDVAPQDFGPTGFQTLTPPPPPPPAAPAETERRREAPSRAEYDVAPAADAAPSMAAAADGWRMVSLEDAEDLADGELVRLDGATVVAAATRGTGAELEVRTVQETQRGEAVTLVQRRTDSRDAAQRAAGAQAESAASEPAAPEVTVRLNDWSVTISAPVTRARLEQLADDLQ